MRSDDFSARRYWSHSLIFLMQKYRYVSFLRSFVILILKNIVNLPKNYLTNLRSMVRIFMKSAGLFIISDQSKFDLNGSIFYPYGVFPKNPKLHKILFDNSVNDNYDIFNSSDKLSNAVVFEHNQSRYVIKSQYIKVLNAICLRLTHMDKFCFAFQKIVIINCVNLAYLIASFVLTIPVGRFGKPENMASQANYLPWMLPI